MILFDYSFIILKGALLTIEIAVLSLFLSTIIGVLGALAKQSSSTFLRGFLNVYTTVIRGIPELVLMLLIFYGGQIAINNIAYSWGYEDYIDVNPFITGVITLGIIYGSYMVETFRGALQSIDKDQIEAGYSFGFSNWQINVNIIIPQMMLHALPGFTNNWLVLLKSTALVSVIGLNDMVRIANLASGTTKEPFLFYLTVAFLFLLFTSLSLFVLKVICRHYKINGHEPLSF